MSSQDRYLQGYQDAFGNEQTRNTNNVLDIASHYEINPERWGYATATGNVNIEFVTEQDY